MSVDVEQLYKNFGVLADAKENAKDHIQAFRIILKGVEGSTNVKRLSAQFIARFFKHFPDESEKAIDALLDLCEDEDVAIRKAALKELPNLCKADKQHIHRLADVLVQILISDDSSEISTVNSALNTMFSMDAKATLSGVLSQILNGDDDVRDKAIAYLCTRLMSSNSTEMSKDCEEFVLEQCKKIMEDVTGDEFTKLMQGLSSLNHLQTFQGRQQLVNIIADQLDLIQDFDGTDQDAVNRVSECVKMALAMCSKNVHGSRFVNFILQTVLPSMSAAQEKNGGQEDKDNAHSAVELEILKLLADLSTYCGNGSEVVGKIPQVYDKLVSYMPVPPTEETNGNGDYPKLQFSHVECLMYTFHQLGKYQPEFLTGEEASTRLKDFRLRVQYFARGLQVYIKELKAALVGKTPTELRTDKENQIKLIALKTCNNVNSLIKDLFHNPPSYKAVINPSWKKPAATATKTPSSGLLKKRPSTGTDEIKKKTERSLYRTPSGKYSSNISSPSQNRSASQNRGGRRNGRGRGRGNRSRGGRRQFFNSKY